MDVLVSPRDRLAPLRVWCNSEELCETERMCTCYGRIMMSTSYCYHAQVILPHIMLGIGDD